MDLIVFLETIIMIVRKVRYSVIVLIILSLAVFPYLLRFNSYKIFRMQWNDSEWIFEKYFIPAQFNLTLMSLLL